jgi:hypothetical protein
MIIQVKQVNLLVLLLEEWRVMAEEIGSSNTESTG